MLISSSYAKLTKRQVEKKAEWEQKNAYKNGGLTKFQKNNRCEKLKGALKFTQDRIFDLKLTSKSENTLLDYQIERDKVLAKMLMIKGIQNLVNHADKFDSSVDKMLEEKDKKIHDQYKKEVKPLLHSIAKAKILNDFFQGIKTDPSVDYSSIDEMVSGNCSSSFQQVCKKIKGLDKKKEEINADPKIPDEEKKIRVDFLSAQQKDFNSFIKKSADLFKLSSQGTNKLSQDELAEEYLNKLQKSPLLEQIFNNGVMKEQYQSLVSGLESEFSKDKIIKGNIKKISGAFKDKFASNLENVNDIHVESLRKDFHKRLESLVKTKKDNDEKYNDKQEIKLELSEDKENDLKKSLFSDLNKIVNRGLLSAKLGAKGAKLNNKNSEKYDSLYKLTNQLVDKGIIGSDCEMASGNQGLQFVSNTMTDCIKSYDKEKASKELNDLTKRIKSIDNTLKEFKDGNSDTAKTYKTLNMFRNNLISRTREECLKRGKSKDKSKIEVTDNSTSNPGNCTAPELEKGLKTLTDDSGNIIANYIDSELKNRTQELEKELDEVCQSKFDFANNAHNLAPYIKKYSVRKHASDPIWKDIFKFHCETINAGYLYGNTQLLPESHKPLKGKKSNEYVRYKGGYTELDNSIWRKGKKVAKLGGPWDTGKKAAMMVGPQAFSLYSDVYSPLKDQTNYLEFGSKVQSCMYSHNNFYSGFAQICHYNPEISQTQFNNFLTNSFIPSVPFFPTPFSQIDPYATTQVSPFFTPNSLQFGNLSAYSPINLLR